MKPAQRREKADPGAVDESAESEITIMPDGRVFAFGITRPLAALLASIETSDERTKRLLDRLSGHGPARDAGAAPVTEGGMIKCVSHDSPLREGDGRHVRRSNGETS
jgi:hypothetical protein